MSHLYEQLRPTLDKLAAINSTLELYHWDMETLAPEKSEEQTGKIVGILSNEFYETLLDPETEKLLVELEKPEAKDKLSKEERAVLRQLRVNLDRIRFIPAKEYSEYHELTIKSSLCWARARKNNDFNSFAPILNKVIEYKKKFASYQKKEGQKPYDVLLQEYEPSLTTKELDEFFDYLKKELIPLIKKVQKKHEQINDEFVFAEYDIEKQKEFCHFLLEYIGFDFTKGVLGESAHPFTLNLHNKDVRITNHFTKNGFIGSIFSAIHEGGHGLYELGVSDKLTLTLAGTGASMAMHESQSRLYENNIARSKEFWEPIYGKLVKTFPEQLGDLPLEEFMNGLYKVKPGLIRIDADELTYPLHIIIRYELEKMIFDEEISVEELPEAWNKKYEEYLGIRPESDAEGVLQDTHWSCGDFGYFPSYAVGSAIAAEIYYHLVAKEQLKNLLRNGNLKVVKEVLAREIHQYGMMYDINELLLRMTNEKFNPTYYVRYLKEKFE